MMTNKLIGFLVAFFAAVSVYANEGKLVASVGDVSLVRDGQAMKLERGAVVKAGDLIKLGAESSAQIRMNDQSIIALGQRTEFRIDDYKFSADKPAEGSALFSLVKGAFRTVTGLIGTHARENYAVKAGVVATIGIRGTHYRLRLCDGDCANEGAAAPANGLYGGVTEGRIGVTNDSGTDDFGADEYFFVADAATRPERLPGPPDLLIDRASFLTKLKPAATTAGATTATPAASASVATAVVPPVMGALDALSNLTLQQLRPAEIAVSTDHLVHIEPLPPPPPNDDFINVGGSGEIRGQIIWLTNADIDLHMIAPDTSHVYYGNRTVNLGTATAQLDHDNLGGTIDAAPSSRIENVVVTGTQIPTGMYNFYAHSFNGNNNGLPTTVQIRISGDGNATSLTDTATLSSGQTSNNYNIDYKGVGVTPIYSTQPR